jgi:isochorismate synthase
MVFNQFFEVLESHFNTELPFAIYKEPNAKKIKAILQNNDTLNGITDFTESGFVFAPFNNEEKAVLLPFDASENIETTVEDYFISEKKSVLPRVTSEADKAYHIDIINSALKEIEANTFKKVVLSRAEAVSVPEINPFDLFKRLLTNYDTAFVYCWYHPKIGLWLGATPETLLSISNKTLKTMALAGTQKNTESENITWGQKELDEQQLVTNYLVDSLKPLVETISLSEVKTVKAGDLLHLKTELSAHLNGAESNLKELLNTLHPTPAICGLPKEASKQFILENENYNRSFYTGFLGELNISERTTRNSNRRNVENNAYAIIKKQTKLFVNLRCMQLKDSTAIIYVGGGITNASNPNAEWEETVNKTTTIKRVL